MATKNQTPAKTDPNGYQIKAEDWGFTKGDSESQMLAALSTRSALTATTYKAFSGAGDTVQVTDLMGELRKAGDEVADGNMSRVEKMLMHQALTLDAIFNNMALRSHGQTTFKGIEVLMRLALKAQAQARSTAEALALLKNPQPYIRQANIAHGPQQVNNAGTQAATRPHAKESKVLQNELLEDQRDGSTHLDTRTTPKAARGYSKVATVEAVDRGAKRFGQGSGIA
jgi:hypothetical protein